MTQAQIIDPKTLTGKALVKYFNDYPVITTRVIQHQPYHQAVSLCTVAEAFEGGAIVLMSADDVIAESDDPDQLMELEQRPDRIYLVDTNDYPFTVLDKIGTTYNDVWCYIEDLFATSDYVRDPDWCHVLMPKSLWQSVQAAAERLD